MKRVNYINYILGFLLIALIAYGSFSLGRQGYELQKRGTALSISVANKQPENETADFSIFWKAYDLLNQKYISTPLDQKKLVYGAAKGLYEATGDTYTMFLSPTENSAVNSSLAGKYQGIGAELGMKDGRLIVVAPLDDSPALAAGIKAGDLISKIDGQSTEGLALSAAVEKIRGDAGTSVNLTIQHLMTGSGQASASQSGYLPAQEISVIRAPIKVDSVKWEDKGEGVAYVRISRFGDTTDSEWDAVVSEIRSQMPSLKSMIIDLRSNPGGYFQSSIHIASEFISDGIISYQEFAHGLRQEYKVEHVGVFTKLPGVVLINKGSASASEILTGALKDRRSFKVVGEKSFGKGTVQDAESLNDGSGVHITIARWLTPNGYNIHGSGLNPDIKVDISDEDVNNGKDPQLDKALEVAKSLR